MTVQTIIMQFGDAQFRPSPTRSTRAAPVYTRAVTQGADRITPHGTVLRTVEFCRAGTWSRCGSPTREIARRYEELPLLGYKQTLYTTNSPQLSPSRRRTAPQVARSRAGMGRSVVFGASVMYHPSEHELAREETTAPTDTITNFLDQM